MNIVCVICSDLLAPSDDVFHTPCGHIFHFVCLTQWLERSKSCPQCREKTTSTKIHRIYFNFSNNDTITEDTCSLQEKVDKLNFQLLLKENEFKRYLEKCNELEKQNVNLMKEVKKVESELRNKDVAVYAFKEQIKHFKQQCSEIGSTKEQIQELQRKIQNYKNIEILLQESAEEVDEMISKTNNPHTLITYISVMKREMTISLNKRKELRSKVRGLQQELSKVLMERNFLSDEHTKKKQLEQDLMICESEKIYLQNKLKDLNQSVSLKNKSSNMDSKGNCTFKENDVTDVLDVQFEKKSIPEKTEVQVPAASIIENAENSIYLPVKSQGLSVIKQGSHQKHHTTKSSTSILAKRSRMESTKGTKEKVGINVITYDGFGGHAKFDRFPNKRQKLGMEVKKSPQKL